MDNIITLDEKDNFLYNTNNNVLFYKFLNCIYGKECLDRYEDMEEWGIDPYSTWKQTTTFKPILKFTTNFNISKFYHKPEKELYPIKLILYGSTEYYKIPTAIALTCTVTKEYFYTLFLCVPHYKIKYLNKHHKSEFKNYLNLFETIEKDKQGNIFCILKLPENWFYPNSEHALSYASKIQFYLYKRKLIDIKKGYKNNLKLYVHDKYLGKINSFHPNNICNSPDVTKPYETFLIRYGTLNKHIFVNNNNLSKENLILLKTKLSKEEC